MITTALEFGFQADHLDSNGITNLHSNHAFEKRGFYLCKVLFFINIALLSAVSIT